MTVIVVLVFCSMLVAGGFLTAFLWAVRNGQYDDTYSPSVRMLFEDTASKREPDENLATAKSNLP